MTTIRVTCRPDLSRHVREIYGGWDPLTDDEVDLVVDVMWGHPNRPRLGNDEAWGDWLGEDGPWTVARVAEILAG